MAYGSFRAENGQPITIGTGYTKCSYYINSRSYPDISIFKTSSTQNVKVALKTSGWVKLGDSSLTPTGATVVAKTNCAFFDGKVPDPFYGIFYTNGKLYLHGKEITSPSTNAALKSELADNGHYPSLCISGNTAYVHWWGTVDKFISDYKSYDTIISGGQCLVFQGSMVFQERAVLSDINFRIAYESVSKSDKTCHYNSVIGSAASARARTLLGWSGVDSSFYMVCTDEKGVAGSGGSMDVKVAAQLMADLNCYSAINLDGGGSTQMITGSAGNWTTRVAGEGRSFCTAVCACTK